MENQLVMTEEVKKVFEEESPKAKPEEAKLPTLIFRRTQSGEIHVDYDGFNNPDELVGFLNRVARTFPNLIDRVISQGK